MHCKKSLMEKLNLLYGHCHKVYLGHLMNYCSRGPHNVYNGVHVKCISHTYIIIIDGSEVEK